MRFGFIMSGLCICKVYYLFTEIVDVVPERRAPAGAEPDFTSPVISSFGSALVGSSALTLQTMDPAIIASLEADKEASVTPSPGLEVEEEHIRVRGLTSPSKDKPTQQSQV
jgi:hypothetical protein